MLIPVGTGVLLVFLGRLAYHRVRGWMEDRGRRVEEGQGDFGIFLLTTGGAIAVWFALDSFLGWQTPFPWRIAAVGTGFIMAEGVAAGLKR